MADKLLEVRHLTIGFEEVSGIEKVVDDLSFDIYQGEIVGIVGESGSGKSMTAHAIMGLWKNGAKALDGQIFFEGQDLLGLTPEQMSKIQGDDISMIFQEPMTSLNPVKRIGWQVAESLRLHTSLPEDQIHRRVVENLKSVGLADAENLCRKYPHQLSGGMRQRVMIAMAMVCWPKLLIADEPTTALDVTVQMQILQLLRKIHLEAQTSILFISHDLNVIREICHRVIVLYKGKIVESGYVTDVLEHPKHDYTKHLVASIPKVREDGRREGHMLDAKHLNVYYHVRGKGMFGKPVTKHVVQDVSFHIREGEILGLVGESGCGKSTLAKCIVGLNRHYDGSLELKEAHPQLVFQDPYSSLNPVKKVGWILEEPLRIQGIKDKKKRRKMVEDMLIKVGLDPSFANRYPTELSGGQRQRISIGAALILNARFIVADEPVSALDVTVQSQILDLLMDLQRERGLTYLFISHDLNIVRQFCHRVIVMYLGEIVEEAEVADIYDHPSHPYTRLLFHSILDGEKHMGRVTDVEQKSEMKESQGCPFYSRCRERQERCKDSRPASVDISGGGKTPHYVKCFKYSKTGEKVDA